MDSKWKKNPPPPRIEIQKQNRNKIQPYGVDGTMIVAMGFFGIQFGQEIEAKVPSNLLRVVLQQNYCLYCNTTVPNLPWSSAVIVVPCSGRAVTECQHRELHDSRWWLLGAPVRRRCGGHLCAPVSSHLVNSANSLGTTGVACISFFLGCDVQWLNLYNYVDSFLRRGLGKLNPERSNYWNADNFRK